MLEPYYIVGPTGSGKSALAIDMAQNFKGEIVNADAFQVYQGLEILTAQPSERDLEVVPHHLYGFLPTDQDFDAARYETLAKARIAEIQSRGNRPIIVGGSGLYVKALTHGLSDLPPIDPQLRETLAATPLEELLPRLLELDPQAASHVNLQNPRHVQRALEICLLTGKPATEFKQAWKNQDMIPKGIFVNPNREELYQRINQRTHAMFKAGVVNEVHSLLKEKGHPAPQNASVPGLSLTAQKAIGLKEILSGKSEEETITAIQQATRRYAKRQVTWFKREVFEPLSK